MINRKKNKNPTNTKAQLQLKVSTLVNSVSSTQDCPNISKLKQWSFSEPEDQISKAFPNSKKFSEMLLSILLYTDINHKTTTGNDKANTTATHQVFTNLRKVWQTTVIFSLLFRL